MDIKTYITDSAETNKTFPDGLLLSPEQAEMTHAVMGVSGEIGEIKEALANDDYVNLGEEMGDVAFYLAIITRITNIGTYALTAAQAKDDTPAAANKALDDFIVWSGRMIDAVKKNVMYTKPWDAVLLRTLAAEGWQRWYVLAAAFGLSPEDTIFPANREKLAGKNGRYKNGYSDHDALHRDLDAERQTLEDNLGDRA